jgi:hypothetical protein
MGPEAAHKITSTAPAQNRGDDDETFDRAPSAAFVKEI